jgi:carbamate kinase
MEQCRDDVFPSVLQKEGYLMENNKVVIALGRSALGNDFPKQQENVAQSAKAIADLIEAKYQVVITHSNGPQVGMVHTAMTELSKNHPDEYSNAPMSVCTAFSQGYIGYDLQNAIRTELLNRGIYKTVVTLITQVRVDPFDPAFSNPVKTLGRYMSAEDAQAEEEKGNYVIQEPKGYQRVYSSPKPMKIYEIEAIRTLEEAGQVVIACGGGGIPVLEQGSRLKGASAVIEKDATAARLADELDAGTLLLLTSNEKFSMGYGTAEETFLDDLSVEEARTLVKQGQLSAATTLPKLEAAVNFVSAAPGRKAVITCLDKALDAMKGRTGTLIHE